MVGTKGGEGGGGGKVKDCRPGTSSVGERRSLPAMPVESSQTERMAMPGCVGSVLGLVYRGQAVRQTPCLPGSQTDAMFTRQTDAMFTRQTDRRHV